MKPKKKQRNKQERVPMRMCIACRTKKPKRELVRFVADESGKPVIDSGGKMSGRGANLCADTECFTTAVEKGMFNRAWNMSVEREAWGEVRKEFEKLIESRKFRGDQKTVTVRIKKEEAEEVLGSSVTRKQQTNE